MAQNNNRFIRGLTTTQGFTINGGAAGDNSGFSLSNAGDFNGDGYDDIIIGSSGASPGSKWAGESYVIYGSANNPGTIDLSLALTSTQGFTILGGAANDFSGYSVSAAGDVNNDGYDDIIIGVPFADPSSRGNKVATLNRTNSLN